MKITDEVKIGEVNATYHELMDGLFTFVKAGTHLLDMHIMMCDDEVGENTAYWYIQEREFKCPDQHGAELMNYSHLEELGSGTYKVENWHFSQCVMFTERAEAYEWYMTRLMELNHF